jgi:hypothetical protein
MTAADEAIARAEELLVQLNARRDDLERLAGAENLDAEAAVEAIAELAELAKQIEAELTRARGLADAGEQTAGEQAAGATGADADS